MLWWNLSKQQNIWMMYPPGAKETTDFTPLNMVILSIEEEVEDVEEEESGFKKDIWIDLMKVLEEEMSRVTIQVLNHKLQLIDHNWLDKMMVGLHLPT